MASQMERRSWPMSVMDGGAASSSTSAAGWKNPVKAVDMCWRVKYRLTPRPMSPTMMFMVGVPSLAEALQRLDDLQVVRVDGEHGLPGVARELLLPQLL